jgi:hypothetical protein
MKTIIFLFAGILCSVSLQAQFVESNGALPASVILQTNSYGSGISFYDFNGDGWDDLSMGNSTNAPHFFVNNQGVLEPAAFTIPNLNAAAVMALLWADIDNDGDADLFITKEYGKPELWINNGNFGFTNELEASGIYGGTQRYMGAAFCDYDHDGYLDLYVCIYSHPSTPLPNQTSIFYKNNGNGTFTDVTTEAGVFLPPRPTFQPVFADVNGDGWEDLYLIIDRVEFRNELFINNGNGTFSNASSQSGSDVHVCSMTGTVGDFENDGDLDLYVTSNPTTGNVLLRNDGENLFTNIADEMAVQIDSYCWGALWIDYDNDSWQDLFVGTTQDIPPTINYFFRNEMGNSFSDFSYGSNLNFSENKTYVCAKGDLNQDGYYDFATINRSPMTSKLFMNMGGSNNYLSVSVKGTYSNPDGIGTWIHCYAGEQHYVRFTLCGENLFAQDSGKNIFGLGTASVVDSMVVQWNRGLTETYYNVQVNQHLQLIEGASLTQPFSILSNTTTLCESDSIELHAIAGEGYLWNTGDTTQSIFVNTPGIYEVTVFQAFDYSADSYALEILSAPLPEITQQLQHITCYGQTNGSASVELLNSENFTIQWNNGSDNPYLLNLGEGTYNYLITDHYNCIHSGEITINQPDSLNSVHTLNHVSCYGGNDGSVMVQTSGGTAPIDIYWLGYNPMTLATGNYGYLLVDFNACNKIVNFNISQPDSIDIVIITNNEIEGGAPGAAQISISGGTEPYSVLWDDGTSGLTNNNLQAGSHSVVVTDAFGCSASVDFIILLLTDVVDYQNPNVSIFPNPANDVLNIQSTGRSPFQVRIYDGTGRLCLSVNSSSEKAIILLSALEAGLYLIEIKSEDGTSQHRLIKQ